jgi:hypothetical protein
MPKQSFQPRARHTKQGPQNVSNGIPARSAKRISAALASCFQEPIGKPEPHSKSEAFITSLGRVFETLCNKSNPETQNPFNGVKPPPITLPDYIERIRTYIPCSVECYVLALVYIDRILQRHEGFQVTYLNVHRLFITAIVVATKFQDDKYFSNAYYSRVGGVAVNELNMLEVRFLRLIGFNLCVTPEEYENYRWSVMDATCTQKQKMYEMEVPATSVPALTAVACA